MYEIIPRIEPSILSVIVQKQEIRMLSYYFCVLPVCKHNKCKSFQHRLNNAILVLDVPLTKSDTAAHLECL